MVNRLEASRGTGKAAENAVVVFSGDLGARYAPLLPAPKSPARADILVIESTCGGRFIAASGFMFQMRQRRAQRIQGFKKGIQVVIP